VLVKGDEARPLRSIDFLQSGYCLLCSCTICIANCVCSSSFVNRALYSCISGTPRSAVSFTTQSSGTKLSAWRQSRLVIQLSGLTFKKVSGMARIWENYLVFSVTNILSLHSGILNWSSETRCGGSSDPLRPCSCIIALFSDELTFLLIRWMQWGIYLDTRSVQTASSRHPKLEASWSS